MGQHQARTGPQVNDAATFTSSMVDGSHPDRPRLLMGARIPTPLLPTTPVAAQFSQDMTEGWGVDQPRLFRKPSVGWAWSEPTFLAVMTPEMFAGSHPDTNRVLLGATIPLPISQTTHVAATFTPDMVIGSKPDQKRAHVLGKDGWSTSQLTFPVTMTPEMFAGSHPDTNRVLLGATIPLPMSQPTHVSAPFSLEMAQGSKPDTKRAHVLGNVGWVTAQTTFIVEMTAEMFAGWLPARFRQQLGPRIPLPLSQPTHTSAPFSPEMSQGSQPPTQRNPNRLRSLLTEWPGSLSEFGAIFVAIATYFVRARADVGTVQAKDDVTVIEAHSDPNVEGRP